MPRYVDARHLGLSGDGLSDNTERLQEGLDLALQGQTVLYLPPGDYRVSDTLHLRSNLTLKGEGGRTRIVTTQTGGTSAAPRKIFSAGEGVSGVVLRDLCLLEDGEGYTAGLFLNPGEDGISDVTVQDCEFSGLTGYALRASGAGVRGLRFVGNHVHDLATTGINFSSMVDSHCIGNRVERCGDRAGEWGVYASGSLENCILSNNVISACSGGIKVVEHGEDRHRGVVVEGNAIDGCQLAGIVLGHIHRLRCSGNIIRATTELSGVIMLEGAISGFALTDNVVDLNGQANGTIAILIANNGTHRGVISGNVIYDGTGLQDARTGIGIRDATRLLVANNAIHDCTQYGIDIGNDGSEVRDIQVTGNQVMEGCIRVKQGARLVNINGNFTRGATASSRGVIVDPTTQDINVHGNFHSDLGRGGSVNGGANILARENVSAGSPFQTAGQSADDCRTVRSNPRTRTLLTGELANSATPEVGERGCKLFVWPANNSVSIVTGFVGGYIGQTLRILVKRPLTIEHSASVVLKNALPKALTDGDVLTLCQFESGVWREV